jgi:outer membrane protein assembly factor BamB
VAKDGHLYVQDAGGIAYCIDFASGTTKWKDRLPGRGNSWGSFLLAGDLIYALSQTGNTTVFKASPEKFESLGLNELGERTNSSIAVADGDLFIRTHEALWRITSPSRN